MFHKRNPLLLVRTQFLLRARHGLAFQDGIVQARKSSTFPSASKARVCWRRQDLLAPQVLPGVAVSEVGQEQLPEPMSSFESDLRTGRLSST